MMQNLYRNNGTHKRFNSHRKKYELTIQSRPTKNQLESAAKQTFLEIVSILNNKNCEQLDYKNQRGRHLCRQELEV
jgi:predicted transcriptional regulator